MIIDSIQLDVLWCFAVCQCIFYTLYTSQTNQVCIISVFIWNEDAWGRATGAADVLLFLLMVWGESQSISLRGMSSWDIRPGGSIKISSLHECIEYDIVIDILDWLKYIYIYYIIEIIIDLRSSSKLCEALQSRGTLIEARDLRGQTCLHLACQSGDLGLVQVLLDNKAQPNVQEAAKAEGYRHDLQETTGWTPLHFAVSKAHYSIILQLLQHGDTDVNQARTHHAHHARESLAQVDKFEWPPILEACSRSQNARSKSAWQAWRASHFIIGEWQSDLVIPVGSGTKWRSIQLCQESAPLRRTKGGGHVKKGPRLKMAQGLSQSGQDLAAKRWMSCLLVSNGFKFQAHMEHFRHHVGCRQETTVQLTAEAQHLKIFDIDTLKQDRDTLQREHAFFNSRSIPAACCRGFSELELYRSRNKDAKGWKFKHLKPLREPSRNLILADLVGWLTLQETRPPFFVPDHLAPRCHNCKASA